MIQSEIVGIIADDLTGANDTALQFRNHGANTKILLDISNIPKEKVEVDVWALSTESRNVPANIAVSKVENAVTTFVKNFSFEYFYKKIDSTLRGHIALETLTMLNLLEYDAAIIVPAFPTEGRITVGGYHLSKGIPIEKTEMAIDPHSPITESHVPTLLSMQLGKPLSDIIGIIDLRTVLNGAGPILMRINELIAKGKRLIISDATSITDIEQIALAINKCDKKLLPTGTASLAKVLSKYWLPKNNEIEDTCIKTGKLPKFIISGTATQITANQIRNLEKTKELGNIDFISLNAKNIIDGISADFTSRIVNNLRNNTTVCIHTSNLLDNFDGFSDDSFNADLTKEKLSSMITDFLAELTKQVVEQISAILIILGGETSYKCCKAINSNELHLIDEVSVAISLCQDINKNWIITKSGNLGNSDTIIDILKYLECHE